MDSRLIKPYPKPSLLKDYLLDDMSSCSSNGFKSFPRKQCCSSVRFIHEFDRKNKQLQNQHQQKIYLKSNKPPSRSAFSALQSVITAVKRLPFGASKSPPEKKKSNDSFLVRSFSKKILKKSYFWKRKSDRKEIVRLKSFDQLLKDDPNSDSSITTTVSKSNSWSESEFTVSMDNFSGGNSSSEVNLNLPESNGAVQMPVEVANDDGVGVTNGDVSTDSTTCSDGSGDNNSKKQWSGGEKEQLSPVSVLDCPFDDEDEVSSPFQHRLARMEGTKKKLLQEIQRFECLASLEPVNLATRFALQLDSDNESSNSPLPHSPSSIDGKSVSDIEKYVNGDQKALELLYQMKISMPSYALNADKLLLDFFRERIVSECANSETPLRGSSFHEGLIEEARDWVIGRKSSTMEWEKQRNREGYVEDMERGGEWKSLDQESEEVGLELENEVFCGLLNELLLDINGDN